MVYDASVGCRHRANSDIWVEAPSGIAYYDGHWQRLKLIVHRGHSVTPILVLPMLELHESCSATTCERLLETAQEIFTGGKFAFSRVRFTCSLVPPK